MADNPETEQVTEDSPETEQQTEAKPDEKVDLQTAERSELLTSLLLDDDIQRVMKAKREGNEVKFVDDDDKEPEPEEEKIDTGDPDLDAGITKVMGLLEKKLSPMVEDIGALKALAATFERQGINQQVNSLASKHTDFDKYRKDMARIAGEVKGLNMEQLYVLAKHGDGQIDLSPPSTHSERPSPTPRGPMSMDRKKDPRPGRKGFDSIVQEALLKLDFTPQE